MKRLSSPLDVQIELTESCNQNCRHCYNYWRQDKNSPSGELVLDQFLTIAKQIYSAKVGSITLTGGEPMLCKNILFGLVSEFYNFGMDIGLNSNGVLIEKNDAEILAKSGLSHALISVLGTEAVHNSIAGLGGNFTKTIQGINNLLNAGIEVSVNMPVSKINLHSLLDTAKFIKEIGVKRFCSGPVVPSCKQNISLCLSADECKICLRDLIKINSELGLDIDVLEPLARCMFGPKDEKEFTRFFGNRICSAAVSSCVISSRGNMRPCIQADVSYGNVLSESFLDVWKKMAEWASPSILPEKCLKCNSLMVCEGGCRMSAKITTGSYNGQDMYMTEPIFDLERAVLLPSQDYQFVLNADDLFEFNKHCIIKEEQEGYVVSSQGKLGYLTSQGFSFVLRLKQFESFSISLLANKMKYSEKDLRQVVQKLFVSGIIRRKEVRL
jgi:radical SAM protein with 4Fe4S-binding SPASM domain